MVWSILKHDRDVSGYKLLPSRPYRRFPSKSTGYSNRLILTQNVTAVTGALMMVNRYKYLEVGGMNAINLPLSLNDVDLCLRLMEEDYWNIFTPYCEAIHAESIFRGADADPDKWLRFLEEIKYFIRRHQEILLKGDPFYNPNLSQDDENIRYRNQPYFEEDMKMRCFCRKGRKIFST